MTIEEMEFLGEEIIFVTDKIEKEIDAFQSPTITSEKDVLGRFKIIKVGNKQNDLKIGDKVLINKNGLPNELSIEGVGIMKDTYSLPTIQRIFCKLK